MNRRAGVVTGVVEEVHAEQGRVRVEYRGIEQSLLSPWAYIAAPMSGRGRGALFMPEPGDEVLVCFGDGDFAHPYVVGFLWNGEQTSPETEAHNRVIVTPGGHQLRFEDKENDTRVILRSNGRHALTFEDKQAEPHVLLESASHRELLLDDTQGTGKVRIKSGANEILLDDTPGATRVQIRAGAAVGVTILMSAEPTPSLAITVGAHTVNVNDAGLNVTTTGIANINCTTANITAPTMTNITTGALNVVSGLASFTGVVQCQALVASGMVAGGSFTPAPGNFFGL